MASKNVPPHLREGYMCNPPLIRVPADEVAVVASDRARPALRDFSTNRGQLYRHVVKQVFPTAGLQPFSQNLSKSPQIPSQQQHPLNEVQKTSTALTKQATGTIVGISNDTPASSPPRHDVKKQTTTKNVEFQVTTGPAASKGYGWPKKRDVRASIKGGNSDGGVSVKSNSNQDPTYDIRKLTDLGGKLASSSGRMGRPWRIFGPQFLQPP